MFTRVFYVILFLFFRSTFKQDDRALYGGQEPVKKLQCKWMWMYMYSEEA